MCCLFLDRTPRIDSNAVDNAQVISHVSDDSTKKVLATESSSTTANTNQYINLHISGLDNEIRRNDLISCLSDAFNYTHKLVFIKQYRPNKPQIVKLVKLDSVSIEDIISLLSRQEAFLNATITGELKVRENRVSQPVKKVLVKESVKLMECLSITPQPTLTSSESTDIKPTLTRAERRKLNGPKTAPFDVNSSEQPPTTLASSASAPLPSKASANNTTKPTPTINSNSLSTVVSPPPPSAAKQPARVRPGRKAKPPTNTSPTPTPTPAPTSTNTATKSDPPIDPNDPSLKRYLMLYNKGNSPNQLVKTWPRQAFDCLEAVGIENNKVNIQFDYFINHNTNNTNTNTRNGKSNNKSKNTTNTTTTPPPTTNTTSTDTTDNTNKKPQLYIKIDLYNTITNTIYDPLIIYKHLLKQHTFSNLIYELKKGSELCLFKEEIQNIKQIEINNKNNKLIKINNIQELNNKHIIYLQSLYQKCNSNINHTILTPPAVTTTHITTDTPAHMWQTTPSPLPQPQLPYIDTLTFENIDVYREQLESLLHTADTATTAAASTTTTSTASSSTTLTTITNTTANNNTHTKCDNNNNNTTTYTDSNIQSSSSVIDSNFWSLLYSLCVHSSTFQQRPNSNLTTILTDLFTPILSYIKFDQSLCVFVVKVLLSLYKCSIEESREVYKTLNLPCTTEHTTTNTTNTAATTEEEGVYSGQSSNSIASFPMYIQQYLQQHTPTTALTNNTISTGNNTSKVLSDNPTSNINHTPHRDISMTDILPSPFTTTLNNTITTTIQTHITNFLKDRLRLFTAYDSNCIDLDIQTFGSTRTGLQTGSHISDIDMTVLTLHNNKTTNNNNNNNNNNSSSSSSSNAGGSGSSGVSGRASGTGTDRSGVGSGETLGVTSGGVLNGGMGGVSALFHYAKLAPDQKAILEEQCKVLEQEYIHTKDYIDELYIQSRSIHVYATLWTQIYDELIAHINSTTAATATSTTSNTTTDAAATATTTDSTNKNKTLDLSSLKNTKVNTHTSLLTILLSGLAFYQHTLYPTNTILNTKLSIYTDKCTNYTTILKDIYNNNTYNSILYNNNKLETKEKELFYKLKFDLKNNKNKYYNNIEYIHGARVKVLRFCCNSIIYEHVYNKHMLLYNSNTYSIQQSALSECDTNSSTTDNGHNSDHPPPTATNTTPTTNPTQTQSINKGHNYDGCTLPPPLPPPLPPSIPVDIVFNRYLGINNSKFIKNILLYDKTNKIKSYLLLIKSYTKHNNISDASLGYISSYTWCILGIHVLLYYDFLPPLFLPPHKATPDPSPIHDTAEETTPESPPDLNLNPKNQFQSQTRVLVEGIDIYYNIPSIQTNYYKNKLEHVTLQTLLTLFCYHILYVINIKTDMISLHTKVGHNSDPSDLLLPKSLWIYPTLATAPVPAAATTDNTNTTSNTNKNTNNTTTSKTNTTTATTTVTASTRTNNASKNNNNNKNKNNNNTAPPPTTTTNTPTTNEKSGHNSDRHTWQLMIEDPFERYNTVKSHNLGRSIYTIEHQNNILLCLKSLLNSLLDICNDSCSENYGSDKMEGKDGVAEGEKVVMREGKILSDSNGTTPYKETANEGEKEGEKSSSIYWRNMNIKLSHPSPDTVDLW